MKLHLGSVVQGTQNEILVTSGVLQDNNFQDISSEYARCMLHARWQPGKPSLQISGSWNF